MKLRQILIVGTGMLTLSGCASMNSEFNCPAGKGIGCKSIQEVDEQVNQGKLGAIDSPTKSIALQEKIVKPSVIQAIPPTRFPETILSIWIAPYEDKQGNYYAESRVYSVVREGKWE